MKRSRDWVPRVISTDKNAAYSEAIAELKSEGVIPPELEHRQAKYLNNRLESDHGKLKRLIRPTIASRLGIGRASVYRVLGKARNA